MIELPRCVARHFRTVARQALLEQGRWSQWPLVHCEAGPHGLHLFARSDDVCVHYQLEGPHAPSVLAFRANVLAQLEGHGAEVVTIEPQDEQQARARWTEGGIPRSVDIDLAPVTEIKLEPALPARWTAAPNRLLEALPDAVQTTARDSVRFALGRIQLRGKAGDIVATDGRQLLIQGGFTFPWSHDVLVPQVRAFGLRELASADAVSLGRLEGWVFVRALPWTFGLRCDTTGRFPNVDSVVPKASTQATSLQIAPEDATFLATALPRLPGEANEAAVTLALDGRAVVRAQAGDRGPAVELELSRSSVSGKPVCVCVDRTYLRRALVLGCTELFIHSANEPILARGDSKRYVFLPLANNLALPERPDAQRFSTSSMPVSNPSPVLPRRKPMTTPYPNGTPANGTPAAPGATERLPTAADLIAEAETLRNLLQEAATRLGRLLAGLKQQRRQSKAMQAAMQSLRQLQLEG